jgi:hypothetical protein
MFRFFVLFMSELTRPDVIVLRGISARSIVLRGKATVL